MGNLTTKKKKFKESIQNFYETYLDEEAIKEQRLAMEEGRLKYSRKVLEMAVKMIYTIMTDCPFFHQIKQKSQSKRLYTRSSLVT